MENKETKNKSASVKKFFRTVWEYIKLAKVELIIMIALFAIDLISKEVVNATIERDHSITVIPMFLRFTNLHNDGAVFGSDWMRNLFGDKGAQVIFCLLAIIATLAFIFIMVRQRHGSKLFRIALGMLAAGAMGNCIDRMVFAYVRDFIEIVYFGLTLFGKTSFYVFNVADAALVIGVILVIVYFIFFFKDKDKAAATAADTTAAQDVKQNAEADTAAQRQTDPAAAVDEPQAENTEAEEASSDGEETKNAESVESDEAKYTEPLQTHAEEPPQQTGEETL